MEQIKIEELLLTPDQRFTTQKKPVAICLHHTAGWDDPINTVKCWQNDKIGRIGTHYVLGGQNVKGTNVKHDGRIVRCIPDFGWNAWHIGGGPSGQNEVTIGIEICSAGILKGTGTAAKKTWFGVEAQSDQVEKLSKPFRGSSFYHKYSDSQIESLKKLLIHLANMHNIDIREGLQSYLKTKNPNQSLETMHEKGSVVRGLYSHTNFRRDKSDIFPQTSIIDMINSL